MLTVKIMGENPTSEALGDGDWRKPHTIFTNVRSVSFNKNEAILYIVGDEEATFYPVVENAFVMNDAGKTISSYQAPSA